jgi:hypothetical protein
MNGDRDSIIKLYNLARSKVGKKGYASSIFHSTAAHRILFGHHGMSVYLDSSIASWIDENKPGGDALTIGYCYLGSSFYGMMDLDISMLPSSPFIGLQIHLRLLSMLDKERNEA